MKSHLSVKIDSDLLKKALEKSGLAKSELTRKLFKDYVESPTSVSQLVEREIVLQKPEITGRILADPQEELRKFPPCCLKPSMRKIEPFSGIIFCARDLKSKVTDRIIQNRKITPERCELCIDIHERQKRINERKIKEKRQYSSRRTKVNYPHDYILPR